MLHPLTELLLAQHRAGTTLAQLPASALPGDLAGAYRIQNEVVAALGGAGGWKVTPMPDEGAPSCAPILASTVLHGDRRLQRMNFPGLCVEVEVALTIGKNLPAKSGERYGPHEIRTAIASMQIAFELVSSRYTDRKQVPHLAHVADLMASGAVVVGVPTSADLLPEFGTQAMSLTVDGTVVKTTDGNATTANMLASLAWLANHAASRELPLKAGDIVITGARLIDREVNGANLVAQAQGLGRISVTFV